jgi:hypothetical protein
MAKIISALVAVLTLGLGGSPGWIVPALAQPCASAPPATSVPADPWPRQVRVANATLLVYQPQVESWEGNTLKFRSAVAVRPAGAKDETFGVIWATVRTQVDKVSHMVALEDLTVTKSNFPTLRDQGASYTSALQSKLAPTERTIALDRLEASLAASGAVKPATFPVNNDPPRVIVSQTPAILVAIDGAPVLQPVPGTRFERVINTRALILREQGESTYYLHVYNGWLFSGTLGGGSWFQPFVFPPGIDQVAASLARHRGHAGRRPDEAPAIARRRRSHDLRERDAHRAHRLQGRARLHHHRGHHAQLGHQYPRRRPAVIRTILAHRALSPSGQSPGPAPPESGAAAA